MKQMTEKIDKKEFEKKDVVTFDEKEMQNENEEIGEEAMIPKCAKDPGEPTAKERALHNKTHLPYRSRCKWCVTGRGRDHAHHPKDRSERGVPSIGVDFFFIGDPVVETLVVVGAIRDCVSKALFAHIIPGQGLDYEWTAKQVAADIGRMGYPKVVLRSDQEPAITASVDKIREIRDNEQKETQVEWAPRYDSDANGLAERGVQAAEGVLRELKPELENKTGGRVPADHPVISWMVRHGADMITKMEIKHNGKTLRDAERQDL